MSIKLIAVDLDGTLLRSDSTVCPISADILRQAVEKGIYIIIATSRRLQSVRRISKELGIVTQPIICADGALVMSHPNGDIWQQHTISRKVAIEIAEFADENDWELTVVAGNKTYYRQRLGQLLGEFEENRIIVSKNIDMMQADEPIRILAYDTDAIPRIVTFCNETFLMSQLNLQYYYNSDDSIRSLGIFPKSADKGTALNNICDRLEISLVNTMAIGDGSNDISMLKLAGLSVVMDNAREEIKGYADAIAVSHNEGGVGQAVCEFVLQGAE